MAVFQFIHIEGYGRSAGAGKAGGRTVSSVLKEAAREPESCPHVDSPKPPRVAGMPLEKLENFVFEQADAATDAKGRKLRKDALVLLAGVASFPHSVDECKADPSMQAVYTAWQKDTVSWLRKEYGENLKTVVTHLDGSHPHIHFYAVPKPEPGGRMSLDSIHRGRAAAAEAKADGKLKGE